MFLYPGHNWLRPETSSLRMVRSKEHTMDSGTYSRTVGSVTNVCRRVECAQSMVK
jgi:hypothetical protein